MPPISDHKHDLESSISDFDSDSFFSDDFQLSDCLSDFESYFDTDMSDSDSDMELDSLFDSEAGDSFDSELQAGECSDELNAFLQSTRRIVNKPEHSKSKTWAQTYFAEFPHKQFREATRMDKGSFFALVKKIEDHPAFTDNAVNEQTPVPYQLAVTLDRLGHDGNCATPWYLVPTCFNSNGSFDEFTSRCLKALDDTLRGHLTWPGPNERARISKEFAKKGFPGCVGLIDGTLIRLPDMPKNCGDLYFDRRRRFSVNAQVVCDHRQKILFFYPGMPGANADLTCLKNSSLWPKCNDNEKNVFCDGQYLMGDKGYVTTPHLVSAFKKSKANPSQERDDFNICVFKTIVTNKHCAGVLKSRWGFLRESKIHLNELEDITKLCTWIGICAKLHNFLISHNDLRRKEDEDIILDDGKRMEEEVDALPLPIPTQSPVTPEHTDLRARVMATALAVHRQRGGWLWRGP